MADSGCGCRVVSIGSQALSRTITDLEVVVRLLEPRAYHGLRSGLLASGPDTEPIGSLVELFRLRLVDRCWCRLLSARGDGGFEAAGCHGERARGTTQTACHGPEGPQLRGCHSQIVAEVAYAGAFCCLLNCLPRIQWLGGWCWW